MSGLTASEPGTAVPAAWVPGTARRPWWIALAVVQWFNLLSAVGGGVGIIGWNGLGFPLSWLDGSPFHSFLWPGVILLAVVGGTQGVALWLQLRRNGWYLAAAGVAGFGMMIWIYVEVVILPGYSILHTIYASAGAIQVILAMLCLGVVPARERRSV